VRKPRLQLCLELRRTLLVVPPFRAPQLELLDERERARMRLCILDAQGVHCPIRTYGLAQAVLSLVFPTRGERQLCEARA
jgi:hypothetical protein